MHLIVGLSRPEAVRPAQPFGDPAAGGQRGAHFKRHDPHVALYWRELVLVADHDGRLLGSRSGHGTNQQCQAAASKGDGAEAAHGQRAFSWGAVPLLASTVWPVFN